MQYLISYDIAEKRIRSKVAKFLLTIAYRVQYSVFTSNLTSKEADLLKLKLLQLTEKASQPLILVVPLCNSCFNKMWKIGVMREEEKKCVIC